MLNKKQIQPGEKVPLKLTATERKVILEDLMCLDDNYEQAFRETPTDKPLMMTLDDLEDLAGYIAAEANHCDDLKKEKKLDRIFEKVQDLLERYTVEELPQRVKIEDAKYARLISGHAVQIAEWAAQALIAAEQHRIKTKPLDNFWLTPAQRDFLVLVPGVSKTIQNKLAKEKPLTVVEVASMTMAVAELLSNSEAQKQMTLLIVAKHLIDRLQEGIMAKAKRSTENKSKRTTQKRTDVLYQFKITLLGSKPLIWRRIQVLDCTLDKLHEHIQTAMGWTNSHLHRFEIKGERYGDPELLDDGYDDFDCVNSLETMMREIVPNSGKRFAFKYVYDFGDGWEHEVLYEGSPPMEKGKKYPLCLEGGRACPPEDVGGPWGYATFLESRNDPDHDEYEMYSNWCSNFDPEVFDPKKATRNMKQGLPDWRNM